MDGAKGSVDRRDKKIKGRGIEGKYIDGEELRIGWRIEIRNERE